jgi:lipopolysaccharide transport system ATP-binding protein
VSTPGAANLRRRGGRLVPSDAFDSIPPTRMSDIAIRVDNLSKQYRLGQRRRYKTFRESIQNIFVPPWARRQNNAPDQTFWALKDVSFEVKQGEVLGIIGRNGAGKSTLLKILSRITEPTRGQVETTGRVGSLLEVGTGFHPELTGRENVFLNGAILGMRKAEIASKFDEIVAFAEVDKFLDTPVKYYSSGMYTRLAFAVAAHLEPAILVVDEVLAVGDAQFQKKCLGKMGGVAKSGRTVLFVSHNMGAILTLCQRTVVLREGKVAAICDPATGVREYLAGDAQQTKLGDRNFSGTLNDRLHFNSVAVNPGVNRANAFSPREPLRLEVEGVADVDIPAFRVTFSIFAQGTRLLSMHDVAEPTTMQAGRFRSAVEIPALLLRPGEYSVAIGGYRDGMNEWIWGTDLMQFSVLEEWGPDLDPINLGLVNVPTHGTRACLQ